MNKYNRLHRVHTTALWMHRKCLLHKKLIEKNMIFPLACLLKGKDNTTDLPLIKVQ